MTSFGPSRDTLLGDGLGFDGEVYTLYVDPNFFAQGSGRSLLRAAFVNLRQQANIQASCVIWMHIPRNNRTLLL